MKKSIIAVFCFFAFFALTASKCNKEDPPKAVVTVKATKEVKAKK